MGDERVEVVDDICVFLSLPLPLPFPLLSLSLPLSPSLSLSFSPLFSAAREEAGRYLLTQKKGLTVVKPACRDQGKSRDLEAGRDGCRLSMLVD